MNNLWSYEIGYVGICDNYHTSYLPAYLPTKFTFLCNEDIIVTIHNLVSKIYFRVGFCDYYFYFE